MLDMEEMASAVCSVLVSRLCTISGSVLILVLVILDRNVDLTSMLSHSWTYQALVHDVLDMKLNRVTVQVRWAFLNNYHSDLSVA
jgi:hypothetical protein